MRLIKIKEMSIPGSILLAGIIVGLSVFLTTWIFFGGDNNRQKLSTPTPAAINRNAQQPNALTPQQIQLMQQQQQQRMDALKQQASSTQVVPPAPAQAAEVIKK